MVFFWKQNEWCKMFPLSRSLWSCSSTRSFSSPCRLRKSCLGFKQSCLSWKDVVGTCWASRNRQGPHMSIQRGARRCSCFPKKATRKPPKTIFSKHLTFDFFVKKCWGEWIPKTQAFLEKLLVFFFVAFRGVFFGPHIALISWICFSTGSWELM